MGRMIEFQPWLAVMGATGWTGMLQEVEDWVDASDYNVANVRIELPAISGCTFYLEGCDQSGGSFTTHKSLDAATPDGFTLVTLQRQAPFGAPERLNNLMRWRVTGPGSPAVWSACFRVTVTFK